MVLGSFLAIFFFLSFKIMIIEPLGALTLVRKLFLKKMTNFSQQMRSIRDFLKKICYQSGTSWQNYSQVNNQCYCLEFVYIYVFVNLRVSVVHKCVFTHKCVCTPICVYCTHTSVCTPICVCCTHTYVKLQFVHIREFTYSTVKFSESELWIHFGQSATSCPIM